MWQKYDDDVKPFRYRPECGRRTDWRTYMYFLYPRAAALLYRGAQKHSKLTVLRTVHATTGDVAAARLNSLVYLLIKQTL